MKDLVVYYSLDGNTKKAAEAIAASLHADVLEIRTKKPGPHGKGRYLSGGFQALFGVCPVIVPADRNLAAYDRIILGTPVWAGKCAPAVRTFLRDYDVRDKVKGLFVLSRSGKSDGCVLQLRKKLPAIQSVASLYDEKAAGAKDNAARLRRFLRELSGISQPQ